MGAINPPGLPVERGKIHEFANAILDDHAFYHDQAAAQAAGFPSVVAPPTYPLTAALYSAEERPGDAEERPGEDNPMPDALQALDMRFVLHGAQEFVFERPLFAGDLLQSEPGEVNAYEKAGKRGGVMKFVEIETVYRDQSGEVVARSRATVIQTAGVVKDS